MSLFCKDDELLPSTLACRQIEVFLNPADIVMQGCGATARAGGVHLVAGPLDPLF